MKEPGRWLTTCRGGARAPTRGQSCYHRFTKRFIQKNTQKKTRLERTVVARRARRAAAPPRYGPPDAPPPARRASAADRSYSASTFFAKRSRTS